MRMGLTDDVTLRHNNAPVPLHFSATFHPARQPKGGSHAQRNGTTGRSAGTGDRAAGDLGGVRGLPGLGTGAGLRARLSSVRLLLSVTGADAAHRPSGRPTAAGAA